MEKTKLQFIDLAAQQRRIRKKVEEGIKAVLDHGQYIMGPEVALLEKRLAEYVGVKHALACSSGTDALLLALMAKGVGPGDAILTTSFTFVATAEVICLLGATPVFVDIDPDTFNISPQKLENEIRDLKATGKKSHLGSDAAAGPLTAKGIIAVDLFGLPCDYKALTDIAARHGLFLIEDGAQAFGGMYFGRKACGLAAIGCTSFFPAKPLGGYGDGGMCFAEDDELFELMKSLRVHGQGADRYDNVRIGINGRLDSIQAAVLLAKFDLLEDEINLRQAAAQRYNHLLKPVENLTLPHAPPGYVSAWAQYSVLAKDEDQRAASMGKLKKAEIPTAIYYPKPLHLQKAFKNLGYQRGDFPVSEDFAQRIFSLPMHPYLDFADQKKIAHVLAEN